MTGRTSLCGLPSESDFADGDDFLDDELLDQLLLDVIVATRRWDTSNSTAFRCGRSGKKKGGKSKGKLIYAGTAEPSGLFAHFCSSTLSSG